MSSIFSTGGTVTLINIAGMPNTLIAKVVRLDRVTLQINKNKLNNNNNK